MNKLLTLLLLTFMVAGCGDNKVVDTASGYIEGVNYRTLATPIATDSEQIEVMEFFWYGCPHCESFEKPLHQWQKVMPEGVELVQSPAIWNEPMKLHAKVFFIVQNMPNNQPIHAALFAEIMDLREVRDLKLQTEELAVFLKGYGLSEADFKQQLSSVEINKKLQRAIELMSQSKIEGTPSILVNGRYLVLNESAKTVEQIMDITSFLVEKEKVRLAAQ
ncbi:MULTISPECIES: thiol:disulfide interchange protein DsbA/DsbL [unclassified Shewanella]|uniref:thiol:disulfide interchange protein DsbA/DsbL n=1 Tax=unclassified Shewanella TaxID=196818 RepID=UPI000C7CD807|nr:MULTISPECIES: thiol:disulfide interchange protein DsbA/DsbL [unclassified Shewanella]PKG56714.1 disulfide bond formation protein DsbA [Shewanella sp. GutDb-MelDb]PKG74354.1 disulfide bond formation protein DsbA [Shewanella sp. GutCb]